MPELEKKPDAPIQPDPVDELEAPNVDEAPLLEPDSPPEPEARIHPLAPGGKRFEQIYAIGKQKERENEELKARLSQLEAVVASRTPQAEPDKEHSWAELETFIQQGRITRADAEAYREDIMTRKLAKKVESDFTTKTQLVNRQNVLAQTVQDYVAAVPAIVTAGSAERVRLDEEFDWLASVQGLDPSKVDDAKRLELQATALRNVYGPIDSLRKRSAPARVESHQGIPGGSPPATVPNKDQEILNKLTARQVAHYKKCMTAGRYKGGWKDVVAEIKFDPKTRKQGGR